MLYERWHETVKARRNDLALRDLASNRRWTFAQLFAAGEVQPTDAGKIVCPQGHSPEFILSLLSAWRAGKIACPLESGQTPPDVVSPGEGCAHLKLTSGTTDTARLIAFTGEQLAADAAQIVSAMGLRPDWPNLGVISLAHSYGFSNLVLPLMLHGIPLILAPAPLPEIIRGAASQEPGVTLAAVPALWRAWNEVAAIPAQVRLAISAGAPLPLNLEQSVYAASGIKIHNFYGASECGGVAYDAGAAPRTEASLVGAPLPGVSLSLNDEGCLTVCSRAVGQTYWPRESASLSAGRFQSSDLAELNDGLVFLRGRAGDQINVAGRKVSPETIERALLLHPLVRDCVVFGAPEGDSSRTEMIVALVASTSGEADLRQFLLGALPSWQVPRRWRILESLPVSPRGKISRAECRAQFMG
ncbi:MAG: class I adenylate-forming enzyme family protein [Limisphaerales bacterium]